MRSLEQQRLVGAFKSALWNTPQRDSSPQPSAKGLRNYLFLQKARAESPDSPEMAKASFHEFCSSYCPTHLPNACRCKSSEPGCGGKHGETHPSCLSERRLPSYSCSGTRRSFCGIFTPARAANPHSGCDCGKNKSPLLLGLYL